MPLSATLEGEFTAGGFSLSGTFDTAASDVLGIALPDIALDADGVADIGGSIDGIDTGDILGSVSGLLDTVGGSLAEIPGIDDLLGPLNTVLATAQLLTSPDALDAIAELEAADVEADIAGLPALEARLSAVTGALSSPSVDALLGVVSDLLPIDLNLDEVIDTFGGHAAGIKWLIQLVGGLMAVESVSREIGRIAGLVGDLLTPGEVTAAIDRLQRFGEAGTLPDLLVGIDPDDPELVAVVTRPILEYTNAVRLTADVLGRGMAFGEATLAQVDLAALAAKLDQGALLLQETGLDPVRSLAEQVREWLQPLLDIALPDPAESLDAFCDQIVAMVGQIGSAIDQLDPASVAAPVTGALGDALAVVDQIRDAAEAVTATIRSAFDQVRQVIDTIDLGPVLDAVKAALDPVADAIDAVEGIIADAQAGMEAGAAVVLTAVGTVKTTLDTARDAIDTALGGLGAAVDALGLENLQETLESAITPIADALAAAQLKPYFDAANDVIDTTADVVDAVPFELLPDDIVQEVADAIEPVKQIDFQVDVADVLKAKLAEILDLLDTSVLAEVEAAYQEVIAFLEGIDPGEPIEAFERDVFDPFVAQIQGINPDEILAPFADILDPIKEAIVGFDPVGELLEPIDTALDDVVTALEELNPAQFIAPIEEQIGQITTEVTAALRLDELSGWLDTAEGFVTRFFDQLDVQTLVRLLDAVFDDLVRRVEGEPSGSSALGSVVAGLLDGAGLGIRMDAFGAVTQWIGGLDGATEVRGRLKAAADTLESVGETIGGIDVAALVASVQPLHRSLTVALEAHPADSHVRLVLDAELTGASPTELLSPFIDNQARYVDLVQAQSAEVRRIAGSARSEVTAIAIGLKTALSPLQGFVDHLRAFLSRIGLDPTGKSVRQVVAELMVAFRPSRLLDPLVAAIDRLKDKVLAIAMDGVITPLRGAIGSIEGTLAAIDISFLRTDLEAIHGDVIDAVEALRPAAVLGDVLTELEDLQTTLDGFDPLEPIRLVIDELTEAITEVAEDYRPTVLMQPVIDIYDDIVAALGTLDIRNLLQPVLDALDTIELQLGTGLDDTAAALTRLQDALPDAGSIGGGSVSVSGGISL